jgi:hypothetical protein
MSDKKPIASISLDLDNKWSYLKTHGDPAWESFPSYLDRVVPRILDILDKLSIRITVFVVGQDAVDPANHNALRMISDRGHEIGNHSFFHEPWLHLYTPQQLERELDLCEEAILNATGQRTVGFRGPGFSFSHDLLAILIKRGYQYDGSTLPTFLGPLARAYYFMTANLSRKERDKRKILFGHFRDGFRSNRPYFWQRDGQRILEIPVTTFPFLKTPIHASYLLYLSRYSKWLSQSYLWSALRGCRLFGVNPSFLLHPLDFLGADDDEELSFFPAMDLTSAHKCALMKQFLQMIKHRFEIVPMGEHAARSSAVVRKHVPLHVSAKNAQVPLVGQPRELEEAKV